MNYLYHRVPDCMSGTILYPLNVLREKYPAVYECAAGKYVGREHLMQEKIGPLNCLWNDVLHFTAVDPNDIKQAIIQAGRNFHGSYYQIDPNLIDSKNAIVYLYTDNQPNKPNKNDFVEYDPSEIWKYSNMNQDTKDYYKETIAKGNRPLIFHRIPHILYKGSIDVGNVKIITI